MIRPLLRFGAWMVCGIGPALLVQQRELPEPRAQLTVRNVVPQVDVVIELQTAEEQTVVPYCGETEYGIPILCILKAKLEVQTREGWRPAKLRTTYGVLGGPPSGRIAGKLIAPKGKGSFVFAFSRRFFDVEVGQQLRVVLDAWPDEQSMRAGGQPIQLTSPPFECPESGTGR